jgi:hypothetical protein
MKSGQLVVQVLGAKKFNLRSRPEKHRNGTVPYGPKILEGGFTSTPHYSIGYAPIEIPIIEPLSPDDP